MPHDFGGSLDQALLRMRRMDDEVLCHASAIKPGAVCIQATPESVMLIRRCLALSGVTGKGANSSKCGPSMGISTSGNT
jgi:hypothetical protein